MTGVNDLDAQIPSPTWRLRFSVCRSEHRGVATVDQTLIRGLGPHDNNSSEGCLALLTGILRPSIIGRGFLLVGSRCPDLQTDYLLRQAAVVAWLTAQIKPTNSRAIAVTTTCDFFPRAVRWRKRPHSRTCAFQAISRTESATSGMRAPISTPIRAGLR